MIHEFNPEIYPRKLWVSIAPNVEELNDLFEGDFEELGDSYSADVISTRRIKPDIKGGILIRFRSRKDITSETIAHESTHAALEIFDYIGARIERDNQEPFAYLVGWIAKCIEQVKRNKFE